MNLSKTALYGVLVSICFIAAPEALAKKGGNGGKPGEDPEPAVCAGEFPSFAYLRDIRRKNGKLTGREIVIANAAGNCGVVVYSDPDLDDLSFTTYGDVFRIAWSEEIDDGDGTVGPWHPNVRTASFTVAIDENGDTAINEVLPLTATKVYRYSGSNAAGIIGLDIRGNRLVFGFEEGSAEGGWFDSINLIEDVDGCIASDQQGEIGDTCTERVFSAEVDRFALWPKLGGTGMRIFFTYLWPGHPEEGREWTTSIAVIESFAGGWSEPKAVVTDIDFGTINGRVSRPDVTVWRGSETLALSLQEPDTISVRLVSLIGLCAPDDDVSQSCVFDETARIEVEQTQGWPGRWSSVIAGDEGGMDSPPNILTIHNRDLFEWDPDGNPPPKLLIDGPDPDRGNWTNGAITNIDPVD